MSKHIIKYTHDDGKELLKPTLWCGRENKLGWLFQDAQHAALAVGGSVAPCKNCIKAIVKELSKEL
jgi:hypothetical protein